MRIAQITDSHVTAPGTLWKGRVDMAAKLEAAVARLNAIGPDLVVHTGDVVEFGAPEEYAVAAEILAGLKAPLRLIPGNHDARAAMRAAFPGAFGPGAFLHWSESAAGLTLIGLDTIEEGRTAGRLCPARAAFAAEALARAEGPALVFLHHPPCPMGLAHMDRFVFEGEDLAAGAVAPRPPLRMACGHVHAAAERHWAGTLVSACPALGVQIPPEGGEVFGFMLEPAAIRLHDWTPETGLTVLTVPVETGPGPYPFAEGPAADLSATPRA